MKSLFLKKFFALLCIICFAMSPTISSARDDSGEAAVIGAVALGALMLSTQFNNRDEYEYGPSYYGPQECVWVRGHRDRYGYWVRAHEECW